MISATRVALDMVFKGLHDGYHEDCLEWLLWWGTSSQAVGSPLVQQATFRLMSICSPPYSERYVQIILALITQCGIQEAGDVVGTNSKQTNGGVIDLGGVIAEFVDGALDIVDLRLTEQEGELLRNLHV